MSNKDWNTLSTIPTLSRVSLQNTIKIVMSDEILNKIKFLCKNIDRVEWSGLLFYEFVGSMKNVARAKIILKDILLMDKGTQAYTEFNWDEDVINYRMANPEAIDWIVGHIHSHNTMNVFFSPTDWSELNDNCPNHNIYLSLIVNNFMDMTAKIAFTAEPKQFICKDENGRDYTLKLTESEINPFMFVYEGEIESNAEVIEVGSLFSERLKEVITKSENIAKEKEKERLANLAKNTSASNSNPNSWGGVKKEDLRSTNKSSFPDYTPPRRTSQENIDLIQKFTEEEEIDIEEPQTDEEEFAIFLLRLGSEVKNDRMIDALEDIEHAEISGESMASSIVESYTAYYEKFFDNSEIFNTDKVFVQTLEKVIFLYEEEELEFDFLSPIILALKSFGNKFEESLKLEMSNG